MKHKTRDDRTRSSSIIEVGGVARLNLPDAMLRGNGIPAIRVQAAAEHEWGRAVTGPHTKKLEGVNGYV